MNLLLSSVTQVKLPWKGFSAWTKKNLPRFDGVAVNCGCLGEAPAGAIFGGARGAAAAPTLGEPWMGAWAVQAANAPAPAPALPGPPPCRAAQKNHGGELPPGEVGLCFCSSPYNEVS